MTNSHTHDNGLNCKIVNVEKGDIAEKEINNHTNEAEAKRKFRKQMQKESEEEDESDGEWKKNRQKQHDRRDNASSSWPTKYKTNLSFTVRSVSDEESNKRNSHTHGSGLKK